MPILPNLVKGTLTILYRLQAVYITGKRRALDAGGINKASISAYSLPPTLKEHLILAVLGVEVQFSFIHVNNSTLPKT